MSSQETDARAQLHIAIVGAGITGINLALGLQARNVSFTIYERSPAIREIGAGIGFSPNAERAMGLVNPEVLTAFRRVANPNGEDFFQWVDGYETNELIFKLYVGRNGFQGGLRSTFLEEWAKLIPAAACQFSKHLDAITEEDGSPHRFRLHFKDGTTATADAVIGCDGIRSRVRQLLLADVSSSADHFQLPAAAHPSYTRGFCFRTLAPMERAIATIGATKALTRFMYNGHDAHLITYPVANNTLLNILAVIEDANPVWPYQHSQGRHTAPGRKEEAVDAFAKWSDTARGIVSLFPEERMDKWGIFDMAEHPAPQYHRGGVCVAGDAAHATGPHLGAGGGMGIEDALVLAALLEGVHKRVGQNGGGGRKAALVERALEVYNEVRYERTQDVVQSTRKACDLFHWKDPEVRRSPEKFGKDITARFDKVWNYDLEGMVEGALAKLDEGEKMRL
ncbi:salicylate hydroxylase [Dichotomopilus funicola]|uniref:Salicylate hydroxylase n=1 Tax=Dichotomopilus funicola TaxID=1934379 RepID=A0AAN6ZLF4_9PEZI|nr:salicylate hydroxylase [Dichotomopilus funicola]